MSSRCRRLCRVVRWLIIIALLLLMPGNTQEQAQPPQKTAALRAAVD